MFAQSLARSPAIAGRRLVFQSGISALRVALLLALLLISACSAVPPSPVAGQNPSDANAAAPRATYRTVVGPYSSQRPGDPSAWREQNERIAPEAKP
jgi:hypothetical protein